LRPPPEIGDNCVHPDAIGEAAITRDAPSPPIVPPPSRVAAIVVMGVSGSGKSSVGEALARRLGWLFLEGDGLHPPANIAKMAAGVPLDDADRRPWLEAIRDRIDAWRRGGTPGVVACSALKRRYRDILRGGRDDVRLAYLQGSAPLIAGRLAGRHGHFMPANLLNSQFAALEPPTPDERAITVAIDQPPSAIVDEIVIALSPDPANLSVSA
jgi:carbohydrate kinase (thermoresistant glucokinase family)